MIRFRGRCPTFPTRGHRPSFPTLEAVYTPAERTLACIPALSIGGTTLTANARVGFDGQFAGLLPTFPDVRFATSQFYSDQMTPRLVRGSVQQNSGLFEQHEEGQFWKMLNWTDGVLGRVAWRGLPSLGSGANLQ